MTGTRQMALPLGHRAAMGRADFLVSACNRAAFDAVTGGGRMARRLALSGPPGAGKSHLAGIWAAALGAARVAAHDLTEARVAALIGLPGVAVEDADRLAELPGPAARQAETALFHLMNATAAEGVALLLTGRAPPARWAVATPDLASRLAALDHVAIGAPDDALLGAILAKLFADRQIGAAPDVLEFLVRRMERTFAAAEVVVEELDRLALAERKPVTRRLAGRLFDDPEPPDTRGQGPDPEPRADGDD